MNNPAEKSEGSNWHVGELTACHKADFLDFFAHVFGHPMSSTMWDWKYAADRGRAIAIWDHSGKLLAHYGGMSRTISFFGQTQQAVQICDVMVASSQRGILRRNGPFFLAASTFLDRHIGVGRDYLVGFGFPNERVMRLAETMKLYASVDSMFEIAWPARHRRMARYAIRPIDWECRKTDVYLEQLWQAMQKELTAHIVPDRNASWWRYRYVNHPDIEYSCYWVIDRLFGRPVCALASRNLGSRLELLDWVSGTELGHSLAPKAARRIAQAAGAESVFGWFSTSVAQRIVGTDSTCIDIKVKVPTSIRTSCPSPEQLAGKWWLTGGDTDFH